MTDTVPHQKFIYRAEEEDSSRWQQFNHRPGDIFVQTPPKSGTTWTQAICSALVFGSTERGSGSGTFSPWIELIFDTIEELNTRLDAQDHQRIIKSHTPLDGVIYWPDAVYIGVFRHPLDIYFSLLKHGANQSAPIDNPIYNVDPVKSFEAFLNWPFSPDPTNNTTFESIIHHYQTYADFAHVNNVHLFHYAEMRRDLPGQMARMAEAIGVTRSTAEIAALAEALSFDRMKADAEKFAPEVGDGYWKDKAAFFDSGTSGKWKGRLNDAQLAAYDAKMDALLSPAARVWMETGR